jgi:tRNA-specific 2-thiouridylase
MVSSPNWVSVAAPSQRIRAQVKIRSRHRETDAWLEPLSDDRLCVEFEEPQEAVTPGQAAVFYDGDFVLGGGWIERDNYS